MFCHELLNLQFINENLEAALESFRETMASTKGKKS